MRSITYVITDRVGIHARPAGIVVKAAQKYQSEILIHKGEKLADAKKLMQLMSLGVKGGEEISVTADGPDEEEACAAMEKVLKGKSVMRYRKYRRTLWGIFGMISVRIGFFPTDFISVIEISKGSKKKYELDKGDGAYYSGQGSVHIYTLSDELWFYSGVHWAMTVTRWTCWSCVRSRWSPLTLVRCYPIGVMKMTDGGAGDEKVIAIPWADPTL